ncbi:MAG: tetratricopeptide (TPR) repeat protein [Candidatus Azotimanducaceae bacterium]|jgi:tetratricopeptide (TPR) repeat protein
MHAVCLRYLGRHDEALSTLTRLQKDFPLFSRAFQEEGHLQMARADVDAALRAYQHATRLNPALLASWKGQLTVFAKQRNHAAANQIKPQLERLNRLPPPLLAAMDLVSQGKLIRAEDISRQFLQKAPRNVEGMRLLADIGVKLGVLDDAEFLLESAVLIEPDHAQAQIDYIEVLRKRQKFEAALTQADKLLSTDPKNPQFQSLYAIVCMQTGDYEKALAFFDRILAIVPTDPGTLTSKGHALKTIGKTDAAIASYRQAMAHHPEHGEAYFSLANLKTYSFSDPELEMMQGQEDSSFSTPLDRIHIKFALGKAYEDREDFALSFDQYDQGNALKKQQSRYSSEQMLEEFEGQKRICTSELLDQRHKTGFDAPDPIFILGLPRAGSTLLEQILASHSQVDGTLELPNIIALSHRLRRADRNDAASTYPDVLTQLTGEQLKDMGEAYIRDTNIHRSGAPFFIDKMPNNFRHIGLMKLILPNAKIIDARRHPMSCCWSGFKQLFAEGQEFTYSLEDIGHYYRGYIDLMNHWHDVLPGEILTVNHGQVVDNLEVEVRRMLDFCGLPFEQACLDFHKTERSVRTPSSEQVRQPIFRDSIDAWQNFDAWLDPLREALGPDIREDYDIA